MSYIQTFSGAKFDLLNHSPDEIFIEDIAHALANKCRFSGHCPKFYSVAQHCVLMTEWCYEPLTIDVLLHDAAEAYTGDISKHVKEMLGDGFKKIEDKITRSIASRFGLHYPPHQHIKPLDGDMLETEFAKLWRGVRFAGMSSYGNVLDLRIVPWNPLTAERKFLSCFHEFYPRHRCIDNSPK